MKLKEIKAGQLVIVMKGNSCEIGKIKSIIGERVFVNYHSGNTAALTKVDDLIKIQNEYCITDTILGGYKNDKE